MVLICSTRTVGLQMIPRTTLLSSASTAVLSTLVSRCLTDSLSVYIEPFTASFEAVHVHAAPNNLRFIIVNRRGYPGSTPCTDAELDDIVNRSKAAIDCWAIMTAHFVKYVVDNLAIPKISLDRKTGGIVVAGWSIGSVFALSLLSDFEIYSKDLSSALEDNVKDVVVIGKFFLALEINKTYLHTI